MKCGQVDEMEREVEIRLRRYIDFTNNNENFTDTSNYRLTARLVVFVIQSEAGGASDYAQFVLKNQSTFLRMKPR